MARVLVIGGTLFIGRALVNQLLARGDEVVIMHRGNGTPFGSRVGEIQCDRNDMAAVRTALAGRRFDVVYDNVYDWQRGTTADQVSAAALTAADGLRRYVFTSSVAVYGAGGEYDEDAPLVPSDYPNAYSVHKAESEHALFELQRRNGLPVATLRPAFIYGPHNPFDREAFFWDRLRAGRPIVVPDDGLRTMQWVHARDVARAALLAANEASPSGMRTIWRAIHPSRRLSLSTCWRTLRTDRRTSCTSRASRSSDSGVSCSRRRTTSVSTSTFRRSRYALIGSARSLASS
jgi:nucleoside-diphosphate-sugar epimerase